MDAPPVRQRLRLGSVLLIALTVPIAVLTLLGLERLTLLPEGLNTTVAAISQILIQLVTIVGAIAVVIGILNLVGVHVRNLSKVPGGLYSTVTLITLVAVVIVGLLERTGTLRVTGAATDAPLMTITIMEAVQVAVESALVGLLFFFLVYAAYRLLRRRATIWNLLFIVVLVIALIGYNPPRGLEFLNGLRGWILNVPVHAGTRGLLLGIAIGTVIVGVRLLIGQDRSFRE